VFAALLAVAAPGFRVAGWVRHRHHDHDHE
jgi:hypothetical protein